jgi:hypothetical protein
MPDALNSCGDDLLEHRARKLERQPVPFIRIGALVELIRRDLEIRRARDPQSPIAARRDATELDPFGNRLLPDLPAERRDTPGELGRPPAM